MDYKEGIKCGVHRLVYFSLNYPHNWVEECFNGNEHLKRKWDEKCKIYGRGETALLHLYCELDTENQEVFETYIAENYMNRK